MRPASQKSAERWLSGRKHRTRNAAYGQPYRGFESHPLRHTHLLDFIGFSAAAEHRLKCAIVTASDDCRGAPELDRLPELVRDSLAAIRAVRFEFGASDRT